MGGNRRGVKHSMITAIAITLNTVAMLALAHAVFELSEAQSEYAEKQAQQDWRIFNLEQDNHRQKNRIKFLEGQVNKEKDDANDNTRG